MSAVISTHPSSQCHISKYKEIQRDWVKRANEGKAEQLAGTMFSTSLPNKIIYISWKLVRQSDSLTKNWARLHKKHDVIFPSSLHACMQPQL